MTEVLVIDDERQSLNLTSQYLQDAGYNIIKAQEGKEGLRLFKQFLPPIVITDVKMPEMDGLEVLKRVKGHKADTVVVVITGHGSEKVAAEAIKWGASNYLSKPFSPGDMLMTIYRYRDRVHKVELSQLTPKFLKRESFELDLATEHEQIESATLFIDARLAIFISDPEQRMYLRFGVSEMLTNALEHGNLGICYDEKKEAFDEENWEVFLRRRMADEEKNQRRIRVTGTISSDGFECEISDEGDGFDWRNVPDPFDPNNMHDDSGRGIYMTRNYYDRVEYSNGGRTVRLRKDLQG